MGILGKLLGMIGNKATEKVVPALATKQESVNPHCPYCQSAFDPIPTRKTKCKSCGKYVYLKRRPDDPQKRLVTEQQKGQIEAEWEAYQRAKQEQAAETEFSETLASLGIDEKKRRSIEVEVTMKLGRASSREELGGIIAENLLPTATKNGHWDVARTLYELLAGGLTAKGEDDLEALQGVKRCQLLSMQAADVNKVEILGAPNSCPACTKLSGKVMTINRALKEMPLPVKRCTYFDGEDDKGERKRGSCRCEYLAVID